MIVSKLALQNFRSYAEREFALSEDTTVIIGKNGVGKTNILEALYVLFQGKSFRESDDILLQHDKTWWKVRGEIDTTNREIRYQVNTAVSKQLLIEDVSKGRFTYKYQLPVVLFEPDDLLLLHGPPVMRRKYIDTLLLMIDPTYRQLLARYERALLQRNNLLKKSQKNRMSINQLEDAVFVWDIALVENGTMIIEKRTNLIAVINKTISEEYSKLADQKTDILLVYRPTIQPSSVFASQLLQTLSQDSMRGFTSAGPHRDDIEVYLRGKPAKETASRGEVRSIILSLKACEIDILQTTYSLSPLYLLDDVFSELDPDRQQALLHTTKGTQKIITTTHIPTVNGSPYTIRL